MSRMFTEAVVFLESTLMHYNYKDRIPSVWQIAVDRYSKRNPYEYTEKFNIKNKVQTYIGVWL